MPNYNHHFKGTRRALPVLTEALGLIPSTIHNSNFRDSREPSSDIGRQQAHTHSAHTYMQAEHSYTQYLKIFLKIKVDL